jgi:hypothetical protein
VERATKIAALAAAGIVAGWWLLGDDEEGGILGDARQAADSIVNLVILRGTRLTSAPYNTTTGVVPGDPVALAASTPYELDAYSLARAISSEEGRANDDTKTAVGWAIYNRSQSSTSITALVTHAKYGPHSGFYGTQRNIESGTPGYGGSDRYCSTANDPYDGDAQIAQGILSGELPDPTGGAEYFDRSASDDNPEQTAANRAAAGLVLADVQGDVDSGLRFWRPA